MGLFCAAVLLSLATGVLVGPLDERPREASLIRLGTFPQACILSSEALAALGAPPLLAHVLCSGSDAAGQQAALELLLQLAALHEAAALPTTAATEHFL